MRKQFIERNADFAKEFTNQKGNHVLFSVRWIMQGVVFFIKNDIIYYTFFITYEHRKEMLDFIKLSAKKNFKFEIIKINQLHRPSDDYFHLLLDGEEGF